ncbi:zinc finger MYM-type protein 1-like [Ambystoma mexicanum]|uniref:zinc finger MYM-type protein 1-like n=1 Tax=Ambystoma mexicanum TaxID=8296 RepID=UPI0037E9C49B
MQNLAFCGTHEKLHTFGNGNFLKFVEYLALFDPLMNEHLRKITDEKTHIHYLGKDIENELIQLLATTIKEEILASVQAANYFSVILDCTPDVSHVEQMTMIVRYATTMSVLDSDHCDAVCIKEHFLGFVPLKETTGANMTDTILHQLQEMSLPIENLRGQGYDNGSNMKGDVYDALVEISNDTTQTGSSGNNSRIDAQCLAKGISSFKSVVSLVVWHNILFEINVTSKQLQTKTLDVRDAVKQLEETKKFLSGCRSDEGFEKVLINARKLAEELEIPACFEPVNSVCVRRKKKQFTYEADDEPIENPKENFKVNFFFAIIATALQSVEKRFTQMHQISSVFGLLYNIHSLNTEAAHQIFDHCLKLDNMGTLLGGNLCSSLWDHCKRFRTTGMVYGVLAPRDWVQRYWRLGSLGFERSDY